MSGSALSVRLHHNEPRGNSLRGAYSLGTLLCERWNALRACTLSLGTGDLTGPGRIPAFHWDSLSSPFTDSGVTSLRARGSVQGGPAESRGADLQVEDRNIWRRKRRENFIQSNSVTFQAVYPLKETNPVTKFTRGLLHPQV